MFIGIAIFVGGMVTILILRKFLSSNQLLTSGISSPQMSKVVLKPVKDKSINILGDILDELKVEKPEGTTYDMRVNVTDQVTELYHQVQGLPWSSFDMDNKGPSPVYFCVNEWKSPEAPLPVGGSIHIDLKKRGAIKRVYLICDSGNSSTVSLFITK